MVAQPRMGRSDLLNGAANTPGNRRSGSFRRVGHMSRTTPETRRLGELLDEGVEFLASRFGTGGIVVCFGLLQLLLQLLDTTSVFATGLGVQHFVGRGASRWRASQLEAVEGFAGSSEQAGDVMESF